MFVFRRNKCGLRDEEATRWPLQSAQRLVILDKSETCEFEEAFVVERLGPTIQQTIVKFNKNGKRALELESLRWLVNALVVFFKPPNRTLGILNSDNAFVLQQEVADSRHLSLWVCDVFQKTLANPPPTMKNIFPTVALPLLGNVAFGGDADKLLEFIETLRNRSTFINHKITQLSQISNKSEVLKQVAAFEQDLGRLIRVSTISTLRDHVFGYASMPFVAAFAIAMLLQHWVEMRTVLFFEKNVNSTRVQSRLVLA